MNKKLLAYLMIILANLFWAGNYIIGKNLVGFIDPIWITFLRWFFASIILLIISKKIENPSFESIKKNLVKLTMMGILGIMGYNITLYTALNYTSSLNASLINSLNPVVLLILSFLFLREKMSITKWIGIFISLIGVLIILTKSDIAILKTLSFNFGDVLMIIAILSWGAYTIVIKKLVDIKSFTATAYSGLISVVLMTPFIIINGNPPTNLSTSAIISMVYIVIFPSVFSFLFWNMALKNIEVGIAGISMNLIPVFIAIISWIMGDQLMSYQLIGGLLVFAGVLITSNMIKMKKQI